LSGQADWAWANGAAAVDAASTSASFQCVMKLFLLVF
jgi:hypothetical protein